MPPLHKAWMWQALYNSCPTEQLRNQCLWACALIFLGSKNAKDIHGYPGCFTEFLAHSRKILEANGLYK